MWFLDTAVEGNGSVATSPSQALYHDGSAVSLAAAADPYNRFVGWAGSVTSADSLTTVTMDEDKAVTATFAINAYQLIVTATSGTVTRDPDRTLYDHGTHVILTPTPSPGYHFTGWTGDITSDTAPLVVTMDTTKTLQANFAINTYTLTTTASGGTVSREPDLALYDHGSQVTLTPVPDSGRHFAFWSGDKGGSADPLVLLMDGPKTIQAHFLLNAYPLTIAAENGRVEKTPDFTHYLHGARVMLTPWPDEGYHFTQWTGDVTTDSAPLWLVVTTTNSLTANFDINTYTLSTGVSGQGSLGRQPDLPLYDHGTTVTLQATPATHSKFVGWTGDVVSGETFVIVTMDGDKVTTASFVRIKPLLWSVY